MKVEILRCLQCDKPFERLGGEELVICERCREENRRANEEHTAALRREADEGHLLYNYAERHPGAGVGE